MISLSFADVLLLMFGAIVAENFVFSKLFVSRSFIRGAEKPGTALILGLTTAVVTTLSSALVWVEYNLVLAPLGLEVFRTMAFVLTLALLVKALGVACRKLVPSLYETIGAYLPLVGVNYAVLGALLLGIGKGYDLVATVCYGLAASLGFTLALLVFAGVRKRIEFSKPPRAFEGLPIALIAAGLVAMAFSGFLGIKF